MLALMLFNFHALSPDWSVHLSSLGLQERLMATCLMYSLCRKYDLKVLRWSAPIWKVSRNNTLITLLLYPRILTEWAVSAFVWSDKKWNGPMCIYIGSDFHVLVQIKIQLFQNTELDPNLKGYWLLGRVLWWASWSEIVSIPARITLVI